MRSTWLMSMSITMLQAQMQVAIVSSQQLCENSACVILAPCGQMPENASQWKMVEQNLDGFPAYNMILPKVSFQNTINCPGQGSPCHMWGEGFGDLNGVFGITGQFNASFIVGSWNHSTTKGTTPPGMCLTSENFPPQNGNTVSMQPCSSSQILSFQLRADGTISLYYSAPVTQPLCLGAPPPPPNPPPGRPKHYFSCTANLAGGNRLPFPFCNISLSEDERLDDLIARATCEEKTAAITSSGAGIPRLGVPALGSAEDTHGVGGGCIDPADLPQGTNSTGCPTTFPAGPGLGATFDRDLWSQIGATIGREARGLNNMKVGPLYFLDPDINLLRDPRWGRAQEVPGECPYLTGEYGTYIIKATQNGGIDPRYYQAASTMKHFQVYDLEGYQPNEAPTNSPPDGKCDGGGGCGRGTFDASPPARDFAGYYMAAFKTVAQRANPAAIMCAYNALYGVPACANSVNNDLVRDSWGWDGFFISDCGAIRLIQDTHKYSSDPNTTVSLALNQGGVDVDCPSGDNWYTSYLCGAAANGQINQSDIDRAARRYWRAMMRLGFFDPMENQPMVNSIGAADVDNQLSRDIAKRSAAESLVLLKNDAILPLDGKSGRKDAANVKFAFIGPHANATQDLLSAPQYHGKNILVNTHSPLQVAQRSGWNVEYARGCNICDWVPPGYPNMPCSVGPDGKSGKLPPPDTSMIPAAVAAAKAADIAVLFLGADQTTEAENFDRRDLTLVGAQEELLSAVTAVQANVIVVLIHGGPIAIENASQSSAVRAIIDAFQPGELGADAIMDLMDGTSNPSGLMPYTTYMANYTSRDIREVDLRADRGTTYWWLTDPPLYPFGFGLSYTSWRFTWSDSARASKMLLSALVAGGSVNHTVAVKNTGNRISDIVVLAFVIATSESPEDTPLKKLFGFERLVDVAVGESRTITFSVSVDTLAIAEHDGVHRAHTGSYTLLYRGGDPTQASLSTLFTVTE